MGEYKREEIDKKSGKFFQILRENSKERYIVRNVVEKPYE